VSERIHGNWFCPLYEADIAEGKCLEINYERQGYMAAGCLDDVTQQTGKKAAEITKTCRSCPNLPFDGVLGIVTFPDRDKL